MGGRAWSEEDEKFIIENHGKLSLQEMADELGRSRRSLLHRVVHLGLEPRPSMKVGEKVNRLRLISTESVFKHGQQITMGEFECDCGETKTIKVTLVKNEKIKSCGCQATEERRERMKTQSRTHGLSNHPLYRIWASMNARCTYPSMKNYKDYGGRGISVCDEWKKDFQSFYDWAMANGWKERLTIDRKDNNGNYSPENCKIATYTEQASNKSNNRRLVAFGEEKTIAEWARDERAGASYHCIFDRVNILGWEAEEAITTPAREFEIIHPAPFTGVSYAKEISRWKSYATVHGKRVHIGYFDTPEEAHEARIEFLEQENT